MLSVPAHAESLLSPCTDALHLHLPCGTTCRAPLSVRTFPTISGSGLRKYDASPSVRRFRTASTGLLHHPALCSVCAAPFSFSASSSAPFRGRPRQLPPPFCDIWIFKAPVNENPSPVCPKCSSLPEGRHNLPAYRRHPHESPGRYYGLP